MSTKIVFTAKPEINQDTGCNIPYCWRVTMLFGGKVLSSGYRFETSECRKVDTLREEAFSLAHNARCNPWTPAEAIDPLENILGQFEALQWV